MKTTVTIFLLMIICAEGRSQIDPELLKKEAVDTSNPIIKHGCRIQPALYAIG
jgi:hypothetical protein